MPESDVSKDKFTGRGSTDPDDPNPPTARTRAIRENIVANTKRLKSSTIALTATVAVVVACAIGIVLLLILRR